ncbi:MAG: hypothetical protein N3B21_14230 [Clostridia bacterium]|nr:hypothetical protein [Clostridia bacterium]
MDKVKNNKPLYCSNCGEEFPVEPFGEKLEQIIDFCSMQELKEELNILHKVEEMYLQYPESKSKMVPLWKLGSELVPTDEEIVKWTQGDKALAEFLLTKSFDLNARKRFVEKSLVDDESIEPLSCPQCSVGIVHFKDGRLREFEPKLSR